MDGDGTVTNAPYDELARRASPVHLTPCTKQPGKQGEEGAGSDCRKMDIKHKTLLMFLSPNYLVYVLNAVLQQE